MTNNTNSGDLRTVPNARLSPKTESGQEIPAPPPVYSARQYSQKPSPPPYRTPQKRKRQGNIEWAWVVISGAILAIAVVIGLGLTVFLNTTRAAVPIAATPDISELLLPTAQPAFNDFSGEFGGVGEELILSDGSSIVIHPWDGQSRFTMVMVGLDRRDGQTGLGYRTDTMMLVSIDPQTQSIGVLSVPRDMFVIVPGYAERHRVNTPMVLGEYQRNITGPDLMMQTVQYNLGIRIHDYVAVDFRAFIGLVDIIGGIDITTEYTINDPLYPDLNYGYDPFYLPAGEHHLNGYDALRFARTRHGDNDIRRAERQQQAIFAIRDKVLSADMIPQLLLQAPLLWEHFHDNVFTGLTLEQVIQLGLYVKDIPLENIKTGVIDFHYLQPYTTAAGAAVLIPNQGRLAGLLTEVFGEDYSQ